MDYRIAIADQLSPQLRSLRKARQLSQVDLAQKLGLSQSRIAAIEHNPAAVSAGQLLQILQVLGVDLILRDTLSPSNQPTMTPNTLSTGDKGEW